MPEEALDKQGCEIIVGEVQHMRKCTRKASKARLKGGALPVATCIGQSCPLPHAAAVVLDSNSSSNSSSSIASSAGAMQERHVQASISAFDGDWCLRDADDGVSDFLR